MIIVIGGTKGGTGKSTLSTNLTAMRAAKGKKVLLVDSDEQKSATAWTNRRLTRNIETSWATVQISGSLLKIQVEKLAADYDDVIIDIGSRQTPSFNSAMSICDLLIIPFKPRFFDIETMDILSSLINLITNPKMKVHAVINQADSRGVDNQESIDIINKCNEFKCLDFTIGNRKSFSSAAADGLSVTELKNGDKKSKQEMKQLYDFIFSES